MLFRSVEAISPQEYRRNLQNIILLLRGEKKKLLARLIKENPIQAKALIHLQDVSLLKREDEKFVTESAYDNPKFVEDVIRDSVLALRGQEKIDWFDIECENTFDVFDKLYKIINL